MPEITVRVDNLNYSADLAVQRSVDGVYSTVIRIPWGDMDGDRESAFELLHLLEHTNLVSEPTQTTPAELTTTGFRVGGRVRLVRTGREPGYPSPGAEGVIVCLEGGDVGVDFHLDFTEGHDCSDVDGRGRSRNGHGWYCAPNYLERI